MRLLRPLDDWILDHLQGFFDRHSLCLGFWRQVTCLAECCGWLGFILLDITRHKGFDWLTGLLLVIGLARFSFKGEDGIEPELSESRTMNPKRESEYVYRCFYLAMCIGILLLYLPLPWIKNGGIYEVVITIQPHVIYLRKALQALTQGPKKPKKVRLGLLVPVLNK